MKYSERIKAYCDENQITYEQFAELADVGRRAVYRWVSEEYVPSLENCIKLNEVLGNDISDNAFVIEPKRKKENCHTICVSISESQTKLARTMANQSERSISYIVGKAIEYAYENWKGVK